MTNPMEPSLTKTAPIVFISYSHDSEEHKKWVRELATALRNVGIDVILDQWEIGPGDDVPKFMEQSVRKALRVIMVCTEQYVRKADDGRGGAGYEAMVVTGELVQDLGSRKFVPVIRQSAEKPTVPACVATRYFVDFSRDARFGEKLEDLARAIQDAPRFEKPPLGTNPFTAPTPNLSAASVVVAQTSPPRDAYEVYEVSRSYANAGNFAKWRELIHKEKMDAGDALLRWKAENQKSFPRLAKELPQYFLPAVTTHERLFAAAFGALDSTDERFRNQLSLLDWIRKPKSWERSGPVVLVELPDLALFTYQALLGALALSRHQPEIAYALATTPLSDYYSGRDAEPLFKRSQLTGWPESLEHTCTYAWTFLRKVTTGWEWLWKLFGSEEDTIAAVVAYYLFLNTVDFISATKARKEDGDELRGPRSPLFLVSSDGDIYSRAQSLYFAFASFISELLRENGIADEALPDLWTLWMSQCEEWISSVYRYRWGGNTLQIPHRELPQMLFRGPQKRRIE